MIEQDVWSKYFFVDIFQSPFYLANDNNEENYIE